MTLHNLTGPLAGSADVQAVQAAVEAESTRAAAASLAERAAAEGLSLAERAALTAQTVELSARLQALSVQTDTVAAILHGLPASGLATEGTADRLADRADLLADAATLRQLRDVTTDGGAGTVMGLLRDVLATLQGLRLEAESIDLSNTTLQLQTDELEGLLRQVRDAQARELTLVNAVTLLERIAADTASALTRHATEATLATVRTATEGTRTATEGTRTATEATRTATEGTRAATEGTRTAAEGTRAATEAALPILTAVRDRPTWPLPQAQLDQLARDATALATNTALGATNTALGTTNAQLVDVNAELDAIRAEQVRRTDTLTIVPSPTVSALSGRFLLAGSGRVTTGALATAVMRCLFRNPPGSGVQLRAARIALFATMRGFAEMIQDPTLNLPTSLRPTANARQGSTPNPAAKGEVYTDVGTASIAGGFATGVVIPIAADQRVSIDLPPLVLDPGKSLGINVPLPANSDTTLAIYWTEA